MQRNAGRSFGCMPPIRAIGASLSVALAGLDLGEGGMNLSDARIGAAVALWLDPGWLEFATTRDGHVVNLCYIG